MKQRRNRTTAAGVRGLQFPASSTRLFARVRSWHPIRERVGFPPDFTPSISGQEIRPGVKIQASDRVYEVDRAGSLRRVYA